MCLPEIFEVNDLSTDERGENHDSQESPLIWRAKLILTAQV